MRDAQREPCMALSATNKHVEERISMLAASGTNITNLQVVFAATPTVGNFRRDSGASFAKPKVHKKSPSSAKVVQIKSKKAVRFSAAPPSITNRHEVTYLEDLPQAWYRSKDYKRVKVEILVSIEAINSVFSPNSNKGGFKFDMSQHCLRGIETAISPELYQRRKQRIQTTQYSVMEQQRLQRAMGVTDHTLALRAVSLQSSEDAQEAARAVGELDSKL